MRYNILKWDLTKETPELILDTWAPTLETSADILNLYKEKTERGIILDYFDKTIIAELQDNKITTYDKQPTRYLIDFSWIRSLIIKLKNKLNV